MGCALRVSPIYHTCWKRDVTDEYTIDDIDYQRTNKQEGALSATACGHTTANLSV